MTNALTTDLDVMTSVAAQIETRNAELRATLAAFIGRMGSVPPSVWGGAAATRFADVVQRWNAESLRLHTALDRIAETMRANEATLRASADTHAAGLTAVAATL